MVTDLWRDTTTCSTNWRISSPNCCSRCISGMSQDILGLDIIRPTAVSSNENESYTIRIRNQPTEKLHHLSYRNITASYGALMVWRRCVHDVIFPPAVIRKQISDGSRILGISLHSLMWSGQQNSLSTVRCRGECESNSRYLTDTMVIVLHIRILWLFRYDLSTYLMYTKVNG